MIIDLDSWEARRTDSFDQVSYSSGYSQARASGAELRETLCLRHAQRRLAGSPRLIVI
jgi:hypothetical protein